MKLITERPPMKLPDDCTVKTSTVVATCALMALAIPILCAATWLLNELWEVFN